MTMPYDIQISDKISDKQKESIKACISHIFHEVNLSLNHWNPKSEVNNLYTSPIKVSDHFKHVFQNSKFIYTLSNKRFDPTLYHEIQSWKHSLELGIIPKIEKTSFSSSMDTTTIEGNTLQFTQDNLKFDFDGITKGYTIDLLMTSLRDMGFKNIFINWSGEIKALGQYNKKRPWKVLVANPENFEKSKEILDLNDMAIATSGDYQQVWQVDKKLYTHFINPEDLKAKQIHNKSLSSVTVRHKSCALADALATAAMTFDDKKALFDWIALIESQLQDVKFWVFFHDEPENN